MAVVDSSRSAASAARCPGWARSLPRSPCMDVSPPAPSAGNSGVAARAPASRGRKARRCMAMARTGLGSAYRGRGPHRGATPAAPSLLHETQGHAVAFADGLVLFRLGFGMVVGRRQHPHPVRVVLGVARIGVDL